VSARFPAASPRFETDDRQRSGIALPKCRETLAHPRENGVIDTKTAMNGRLFFSFGIKRAGFRFLKFSMAAWIAKLRRSTRIQETF
jgi:hypothetical protein